MQVSMGSISTSVHMNSTRIQATFSQPIGSTTINIAVPRKPFLPQGASPEIPFHRNDIVDWEEIDSTNQDRAPVMASLETADVNEQSHMSGYTDKGHIYSLWSEQLLRNALLNFTPYSQAYVAALGALKKNTPANHSSYTHNTQASTCIIQACTVMRHRVMHSGGGGGFMYLIIL